MCVLSRFSHVRLFETLWTEAQQAPLFMGFSRQKYWNELPCPPPGYHPDPGMEPAFLMFPVLAGRFFTSSTQLVPFYVYPLSFTYYFRFSR